MNDDHDQTNSPAAEFDFSAFPENALFHERRSGAERRRQPASVTDAAPRPGRTDALERRVKKERRRRIDPTTFEKQYTDEEMEFMNAIQRYKELSGKAFPSYGDVLKVAIALGYRKAVDDTTPPGDDAQHEERPIMLAPVHEC
jgi:hypothetical protein